MAALPHLKREGKGALIHVSSVEAKRSFPFHGAYCASKHGIDGFLEALRVELRHERWPIGVTQVMPGTINTPFFDKGRTKLGVKAVGVPPIYEPKTVADVILYAAEHPARPGLGGAAQALILNQRLSPRMLDAVLATRAGFAPQKTHEPRSEHDPDHLYAPIRGHDTAKNGFRALSRSLYNWLRMHPAARHRAGHSPGSVSRLARKTVKPLRRQHKVLRDRELTDPLCRAKREVPARGRRLLERRHIGTLSASSTHFGPFFLSTESEWCWNGASLGKRASRRSLGRGKEGSGGGRGGPAN